MLRVQTLVVGALQTNCYLVWDESLETLIIDPGDAPEFIAEKISQLKLQPKYIVATHGHYDHILGAFGLRLILQIPFHININDEFLVKSMKKRSRFLQNDESENPPIDGYLDKKKSLTVGKLIWQILETPGHTPGSICLFNKQESILFSGDTLFSDGVGRTDLAYSNVAAFGKSLQKLFTLPKTIKIYPGHGRSTILGQLVI